MVGKVARAARAATGEHLNGEMICGRTVIVGPAMEEPVALEGQADQVVSAAIRQQELTLPGMARRRC